MSTTTVLPAASAVADVTKPASPSGTSEDSILKRMEDAAAEPPKPVEPEKPADEGKPPEEAKPEIEAKPEEAEPEPDLEERPALPEDAFHKYREDGTFKAHPELRSVLGRHEAYSELGSVSELRSLRETFPTQEDVEQVTHAAEELKAASESFRTDPAAFAENLREIDAGAFQKLALEFPKVVAQLDPQIYSTVRIRMFEESLNHIYGHAEYGQDAELLEQLEAVAIKALGHGLSTQPRSAALPDPRDAELTRLRREKDERGQSDRQGAFQQFHADVEGEYMQQSLTDIEAMVVKAFPGIVEEDKKDIIHETWDKLQETLTAQPQTKAYAQQAYKDAAEKGRVGPTEQKALIEFLVKRAKLAIPGVTKGVLTKWTRRLVGANKAQLDKAREVAAQGKDAGKGAGAPAAPAGKPVVAAPVKRQTEDEIFAELEAQIPR